MKIKSTLLSLSAGLFLAGSALAATSVGIVNLNSVFQNVPQGSAALASLKQELAPQVQQLQAQQQALQQKITAYNSNSANLSKKASASQKQALMTEQANLQQTVQAFQQSATQKEQDLLTSFNSSLKTASTSVAKADGVELVLSSQNALYNADSIDLTTQVVAAMQQLASTSGS